MATVTCPGCLERDERIADLGRRVAGLGARLATNATNASVPPSANPPDAPRLPPKRPTGRTPGAPPGPSAHLKRRLPPERLSRVVSFAPTHCDRCHEPLPATAAPEDPPPSWHQVADLPPVTALVVAYRGEYRTCTRRGARDHAAIPADVQAHGAGPLPGPTWPAVTTSASAASKR